MLSSSDQLLTRNAEELFIDYRKKAFEEKRCEKQATHYENILLSCQQESFADWKLPKDLLKGVQLAPCLYPKYMFANEKGRQLALESEQRHIYDGLKKIVQDRRDRYVNTLTILREEKADLIDKPYEALAKKVPSGLTDPERDFIVCRFEALRSSFEAKAKRASQAVSSDLSSTQVEHPTPASQDVFRDDDFLRDEDDSMQVDNQGSDLRTLILSLKEEVNTLSSRIVKIEKTPIQKNLNPRSANAGGANPQRRSGSAKPTDNNARRGRSATRYDNRRSPSTRRSPSSEKSKQKSVSWRSRSPSPAAAGGGRGSASQAQGRKDDKRRKPYNKK